MTNYDKQLKQISEMTDKELLDYLQPFCEGIPNMGCFENEILAELVRRYKWVKAERIEYEGELRGIGQKASELLGKSNYLLKQSIEEANQ